MAKAAKAGRRSPTALSLFSGAGRSARFLSNRGFSTAEVDWEHNSCNDLSTLQGCADAELLELDSDVLMIEIDCATWSTARRAPATSSLPHRLRRAGKFTLGLPNLPQRDRQKLQAANRCVRSTVRMVKSSIRRGKSVFLENPHSSLIWGFLEKSLDAEIAAGKITFCTCTMCAYGTPWRKGTKVMLWGPQAANVALRKCCSKKLCQFSKKMHEPLSSNTVVMVEDKVFATKKAQTYPNKFVRHLLGQLVFKDPTTTFKPG